MFPLRKVIFEFLSARSAQHHVLRFYFVQFTAVIAFQVVCHIVFECELIVNSIANVIVLLIIGAS